MVNQEIRLPFIDLEKAYDCIFLKKIWEALETLEVERDLLKIFKEFHRENQSYVKIRHVLFSPINPMKSRRQGCRLSPLLFSAYIAGIEAGIEVFINNNAKIQ